MKYFKVNIDEPAVFSMAGEFTADSSWMHMERIMPNYEIIIVIKGTVFIQQDEDKYELNEGDMLLLMADHVHKGYAKSAKGTTFYWFHFSPAKSCSIIDKNEVISQMGMAQNNPYFNGLNSDVIIPIYFKGLKLDTVSVLFHQLVHLSQAKYYTSQSVNYILTSLLIEITEQLISNFETIENEYLQKDKLSKILQWIRIHIDKNISLKDAAYEFNFSKEYLARFFKKRMGMSMQEYINYLRISNAKELLFKTDLNINEISRKLGFKDEKYFLKLFKKYENQTPKQFRNSYNMTFINIK